MILTLKQHKRLKELKKKYGYELAENKGNPDLVTDEDIFYSLITYEFDKKLVDNIHELVEHMPEDQAIRLACGILAKTTGHMLGIYDKKYKGYSKLKKLFDDLLLITKNEVCDEGKRE